MACVSRIALFALIFVTLVFGQSIKAHSPQDSSGTNVPPLHVDVDLVLVAATVTDPSNRYVTGLGKEYFQIWEDKIQQDVQYFSAEQVPLTAGIIFDVSGSMQNKLAAARAAAGTFIQMGTKEDEYFLIEFSDSPRLAQDFTTDITKIQSKLIFTRAKGQTSLYDALYLGLQTVSRGNNSRKALVLITDGEDNHSRYSLSDVREFAREHDVLIYAIGIVDETGLPGTTDTGRGVLVNLASMTGGAAFFPDNVGKLGSICAQIAMDLKNQYTLGYRPVNRTNDGRWRKIQVKINRQKGMPRMSVRAKSGYYASAIDKPFKK
jgi:Ca-activated chloride channel homolog